MNLGRRFLTISAVLVAASLVATACGDASDDNVVASIADQTLTQSELDGILEFGDATVPQLIADEVSTWLQRLAMSMEAERLGLEPTDEDRDSADLTAGALIARQPNLDRDTLIEEILISIVLGRWADEEATTRDPLDPPDLLCSNHILFEAEADALVGLDRYINGENFAELAMELSVGPTGPAGGSLDCQLTGTFVPEFEDLAYKGQAGEVVGPVETQFGWHLIEIQSIGPATAELHPSADPQVIEQAAALVSTALVESVILDFQEDARARYADSVTVAASIGTIDLSTYEITAAE
ncbi:MAG: hypothetical protein HOH36_05375 [Acidimicrobiaceae bacterium]|nr:hypothetical protein [Acidimicrobiaceae bacterium]MBT5849854.1 hypothetical protein [Acidimicrobiaceae bacterium]